MAPTSRRRADEPSELPRGGGLGALAFVALSLVALAAVPLYVSRGANASQRQITEVLEPAARASARLLLNQASQLSRYQAFLLTGDPSYRLRYSAAVAEEGGVYEELNRLAQRMDFPIRDQLARLTVLSTQWHLAHDEVLSAIDTEEGVPEGLGADQRAYDELQRDTRQLQIAIQDQVDAGRARMARGRALQSRITVGLAALALGATVVLAFLGRRLRILTAEAQSRRRDAVRARREVGAIMEATGDGVLGIDLQGKCISLNRAGTELLGYAEHDIKGRDVHDAIHHTTAAGTPRARDDSPILTALRVETRAQSPDEDVLWRHDGTSFPARWSLRPLVDGLTIRGAVLTFTDMTETHERELALHRAVRAREEVVSVFSHDLRNPLGVVAAAADLLIELPLSPTEQRKQAEIIARSAARMGRLIDDLLDVARMEAGALRLRRCACEVAPILAESVEVFEPQAVDAGVRLEHVVGPDTPRVLADRDRLLQALANLVSNALRHTPRGGTIELVAGRDGEERVAIAVRDDGTGIEPEALDRLFDRFWRPSETEKRGSGLGLAIVKGIAEGLDGDVSVESEPGRGATFTLRLPAAEPR